MKDVTVESQLPKTADPTVFYKRVVVVVLMLPVGLAGNYFGGWFYSVMVAVVLGLAVYEYTLLFQSSGLRPFTFLAVVGTVALVVNQTLSGVEVAAEILSLCILFAIVFHLLEYEKGRQQAATDFAVTVSAILYIGWIGAYLVMLRNLPDGLWWVLTVLPAVWLADTGAYLVGVRIGRHKITRRLSPNKSWEGYIGGILISVPGTMLLALLWQFLGAGDSLTPLRAGILALVLSALTIFGDLGESMIKRQVGAKDSSQMLPGHGGVFDRIDSWLWGGVLGYYIITIFYL